MEKAKMILSVYCASSIALQICLTFFLGLIWKLKLRYTIYEARLGDGQDIAIFMLCTFMLILAPLCMPFLICGCLYEIMQLLRIRKDWMKDRDYRRITEKYNAKYW
jgi:hypothetical protein